MTHLHVIWLICTWDTTHLIADITLCPRSSTLWSSRRNLSAQHRQYLKSQLNAKSLTENHYTLTFEKFGQQGRARHSSLEVTFYSYCAVKVTVESHCRADWVEVGWNLFFMESICFVPTKKGEALIVDISARMLGQFRFDGLCWTWTCYVHVSNVHTIHLHTYMYMCICIYIDTYIYVYTYVCIYIYIDIFMYANVHIYVYIYIYIYIHKFTSIRIYMYIYIYTYIEGQDAYSWHVKNSFGPIWIVSQFGFVRMQWTLTQFVGVSRYA